MCAYGLFDSGVCAQAHGACTSGMNVASMSSTGDIKGDGRERGGKGGAEKELQSDVITGGVRLHRRKLSSSSAQFRHRFFCAHWINCRVRMINVVIPKLISVPCNVWCVK